MTIPRIMLLLFFTMMLLLEMLCAAWRPQADPVTHGVSFTIGGVKNLVLLFILALCLAGCADTNYALQRVLISADCRPERLQANGQCTPLK